jgi:hypothetical protein
LPVLSTEIVDDRIRPHQLPRESGDLALQMLLAPLLRRRRIDLRTAAYRAECCLVGSSQLLAPAGEHRGIYPLLAHQRAALTRLLAAIVLAQDPAFVGSRNNPPALDGHDLGVGSVGGRSMRRL